ncbi:MAG: hypothetical protein M1294_13665 [Firmicutes bacterium]|uniref:Yip1 domain-containing protein n=1 Tax=Sulfobacillus benefaciens TaxID=453960 RepID=A0A2T2XAE2_9FIRM|nr:hypothetical protein [Bacillota bacterium]MCL5015558.1 hypothetical protein [Bacillota bacterium]PSR31418.1 MAG: hypothetical protein C7B43_01600 [Sulfobacillus benefaciens]HBQ94505.1 hypothetical protein [Sulfobacillus sp.]
MSKKPISFKSQSRRRRLEKQYRPRPRKQVHEWDDLVDYWRIFIRNPFQLAGRAAWTERMLWSNAILAGLLAALRILVFSGFHLLVLLSVTINRLFDAFLFYYALTWLVVWVLNRTEPSQRRYDVDILRRQAIVYSGWLVIIVLAQWIPFPYIPSLLSIVVAFFGVRAVRWLYNVTWVRSAVSVLTGTATIWVLIAILNRVSGL